MSAMQTAVRASRSLPFPAGLGLARHVVGRNMTAFRRAWLLLLSGFVEPVFYLFSIGVGLGALVGDVTTDGGMTVPYAAFVAPALLASSAMNGAVADSTYNVFFKLKYQRLYDAMLATPLGPRDVAVGEITWSLMRGALYSAMFLVVALVAGLVQSWWALLAVPAAVLIGLAFGAVGMFATTYMKSWQHFDYVTLAIQPMFLFSATFFPLSTYPPSLQWVVGATPLYQGVALERGADAGGGGLVAARPRRLPRGAGGARHRRRLPPDRAAAAHLRAGRRPRAAGGPNGPFPAAPPAAATLGRRHPPARGASMSHAVRSRCRGRRPGVLVAVSALVVAGPALAASAPPGPGAGQPSRACRTRAPARATATGRDRRRPRGGARRRRAGRPGAASSSRGRRPRRRRGGRHRPCEVGRSVTAPSRASRGPSPPGRSRALAPRPGGHDGSS